LKFKVEVVLVLEEQEEVSKRRKSGKGFKLFQNLGKGVNAVSRSPKHLRTRSALTESIH
jgi:hypothetical protein